MRLSPASLGISVTRGIMECSTIQSWSVVVVVVVVRGMDLGDRRVLWGTVVVVVMDNSMSSNSSWASTWCITGDRSDTTGMRCSGSSRPGTGSVDDGTNMGPVKGRCLWW